MLAPAEPLMTPEEYLCLERSARVRSEYHRGRVYAMAGAGRNHNRIVTNISTSLDLQLRDRDCNNYSSDMRVGIQAKERYLYPDIVVTCGTEEFEDDQVDTLLNPMLVIEVLSASTEAYDRGIKFLYYQSIASLQEYVLVSQAPHRIELYRKQDDGAWGYRSFQVAAATVELASIDCILELNEMYFKVTSPVTQSTYGRRSAS